MVQPIKDCNCEDWPCCEHADNFPTEPDYCDICGYNYYGAECPNCYAPYDPSEDEEPTCDICGALAEDDNVEWCGNCGCCKEHCQHEQGCDDVVLQAR